MPEGDTITPVVSSPALRFSRNFMFPDRAEIGWRTSVRVRVGRRPVCDMIVELLHNAEAYSVARQFVWQLT